MITNKDINEEITKIEKLVEDKVIKDAYQISVIKLLSLTLKLQMSMRTNQTLTMDKLGVKKIAPVKRDNADSTKEEK